MIEIEIRDPLDPDNYIKIESVGINFQEFRTDFYLFMSEFTMRQAKSQIRTMKKRIEQQKRIIAGLLDEKEKMEKAP